MNYSRLFVEKKACMDSTVLQKGRILLMNKILMRLMAVFISAFALICLAPALKAEAKDDFHYYKPVTIKQGKWTKMESSEWIESKNGTGYEKYHVYKINVPAGNGYVKIDLKRSPKQTYTRFIEIQKSLKDDNSYIQLIMGEDESSKTEKMILRKGTYYIYEYYGFNVNIRWKFVKVPDYKNYCRAKARKLVQGKKETVIITRYGSGYDKWYKIKLEKNQRITINFKKKFNKNLINNGSFRIYSSKGRGGGSPGYLEIKEKKIITEKLKKGTYYLRFCTDDDAYITYPYNEFLEYEFSWK